MAKIYTKVGDKGLTALVGGQKVKKSDLRIAAYGTVDELNSVLGWARVQVKADGFTELDQDLTKVQHWLFDLGSLLATLPEDRAKYALPPLSLKQIEWFEKRIDTATAELPPLKEFILPAGTELTTRLQIARTVTRRAERCLIAIQDDLPENAVPFINRLSDYLFTIARWCGFKKGTVDVVWEKSTL